MTLVLVIFTWIFNQGCYNMTLGEKALINNINTNLNHFKGHEISHDVVL